MKKVIGVSAVIAFITLLLGCTSTPTTEERVRDADTLERAARIAVDATRQANLLIVTINNIDVLELDDNSILTINLRYNDPVTLAGAGHDMESRTLRIMRYLQERDGIGWVSINWYAPTIEDFDDVAMSFRFVQRNNFRETQVWELRDRAANYTLHPDMRAALDR